MESKETLTAQIAARKAALDKQAAKDSKATADHVRQSRRMLKRAQRRLSKLVKATKSAEKPAEAKPAESKPAEVKTGG